MVLSICKDKGRRLRICDLWLKYPRKGYKIEIMKGMFPMNMFKKNGGFTLVELIVVIAILAILAGVAVPAYSGYITKAKDAAVITELDAIQTAAQAANATAGALSKITVDATTGAVTITPATGATKAADWEANFLLFYGSNVADVSAFADSSYKAGATWNNGKWEPGN